MSWKPRSVERSLNWESWVFECAAELFSRYSENRETIEVKKIGDLISRNDATLRRLTVALYPVELMEVLSHATSSPVISQDNFSKILVDTMHRLEVFDKATTSSKRDPDLEALVSNIYEAVSEDVVLSAHSSKHGKTLQKDLWILISDDKEGISEMKTMTAREWLRFAAEYTLRTKLKMPPPLSPCRPIRSPLAEDRPRRASVMYPEDMIQRSLQVEFSKNDVIVKDDEHKFSLITVNQIQNDINEIRKALDAERAEVGELKSQVSDKDNEIVDLKKEIVILYAERNRSAKHHQNMQQQREQQQKDALEFKCVKDELKRVRDELKCSQIECEELRGNVRELRKRKKKDNITNLPSSLSLREVFMRLVSESMNKKMSSDSTSSIIPEASRKRLENRC